MSEETTNETEVVLKKPYLKSMTLKHQRTLR